MVHLRAVPALLALILLTAAARAAGSDDIAGQWDCGRTRLSISRLGSIEVLVGKDYRAGLFERQGQTLIVTWDGGGRGRVTVRPEGRGLRITGISGIVGVCVRRK